MGRLGVRAVGMWALLFCLAAPLSACTHRYYTLSPIQGITYIDVFDNYGNPSGKITDRAQVARIVAFLNTLRDRWYDPEGIIFATRGSIDLHGPSAWVDISFGIGGMYLTRKGMTYTDSVKTQNFVVIRTEDSWHDGRDMAALCRLLGNRFHDSCVRQGEERPSKLLGTEPPNCRCDPHDERGPTPRPKPQPSALGGERQHARR